MKKVVIIKGSSRSLGNTHQAVCYLNKNNHFDVIDLKLKNINHFDYDFKNKNDDFLPLIKQLINNYNTFIFATPIYWYSMSGILKVFFDRISDLLITHKELGKQLRGKTMGMISNSDKNDRPNNFATPFVNSANYLDMDYVGDVHSWFNTNNKELTKAAKELLDTYRNLLT